MSFSNLIQHIGVHFQANERHDLLRTVVERLFIQSADTPFEQGDIERVLFALEEREKCGGTGFKNRLAIPHAKIPGLQHSQIALVTNSVPLDFQSLDKKACQLFIIILSPDGHDVQHLRLLARLARFFSQSEVVNTLLDLNRVEDIRQFLLQPP